MNLTILLEDLSEIPSEVNIPDSLLLCLQKINILSFSFTHARDEKTDETINKYVKFIKALSEYTTVRMIPGFPIENITFLLKHLGKVRGRLIFLFFL